MVPTADALPHMRFAAVAIIAAILAAGGCATGGWRGPLDDEFTAMGPEERARMCAGLFREAKLSCRDGLQDRSASQSFECLSARMKLDRYCMALK